MRVIRSMFGSLSLSAALLVSACGHGSSSPAKAPVGTEPVAGAKVTSASGARIETLRPPSPLPTRDRTLLTYELTIAPTSTQTLARVSVEGAGVPALDLSGAALAASTFVRGADHFLVRPSPASIESGQTAIVFVTHELPLGGAVPDHLTASITLRSAAGVDEVTRLDVPVLAYEPVVLGAPVAGKGWVAFNAISNTSGHRRAVPPLPELHVPERYAIDFIVADDAGALASDPKRLESWFCYGKPLLAVGNGTIAQVSDGAVDQPLGQGLEPASITPETIAGNMVLLQLDGGGYVLYAHIAPGAVKVKVGDHVAKGDVLGLLGNSGNSTAPHLHIHVADRPDALASEGVPFVFERFTYAGKADITPFNADEDRILRPERRADAVTRANAAENEIVDF